MQYQIPPVKPRVEGATVQATSLFPPNQPEQQRYALLAFRRYRSDAVAAADLGPTIAPVVGAVSMDWKQPFTQPIGTIYPIIT